MPLCKSGNSDCENMLCESQFRHSSFESFCTSRAYCEYSKTYSLRSSNSTHLKSAEVASASNIISTICNFLHRTAWSRISSEQRSIHSFIIAEGQSNYSQAAAGELEITELYARTVGRVSAARD